LNIPQENNVCFEVNTSVTQTCDAAPFLNGSFLSKFYVAEYIFLCVQPAIFTGKTIIGSAMFRRIVPCSLFVISSDLLEQLTDFL
jgi:hypothetical protein